jgi:hypothetical protein
LSEFKGHARWLKKNTPTVKKIKNPKDVRLKKRKEALGNQQAANASEAMT